MYVFKIIRQPNSSYSAQMSISRTLTLSTNRYNANRYPHVIPNTLVCCQSPIPREKEAVISHHMNIHESLFLFRIYEGYDVHSINY